MKQRYAMIFDAKDINTADDESLRRILLTTDGLSMTLREEILDEMMARAYENGQDNEKERLR